MGGLTCSRSPTGWEIARLGVGTMNRQETFALFKFLVFESFLIFFYSVDFFFDIWVDAELGSKLEPHRMVQCFSSQPKISGLHHLGSFCDAMVGVQSNFGTGSFLGRNCQQ